MQYPWGHQRRYNSYSHYIKTIFGEKIQKLSIDAGFSCPNRDDSKGTGGCTYCNNDSFKPEYCKPKKTVTQQLQEGMDFFARRTKPKQFLAYFQAYSNTYAPIDKLRRLYFEALRTPQISGLVISTRPDCVDGEKLELLEQLAKKYYVALEFGVESCYNETLLKINRCHTFEDSQSAILSAADRGFSVGAHLILGLPGENGEMILDQAEILNGLPIKILKLHQLQIMKRTKMAQQFLSDPDSFNFYSVDEYVNLVIKFLERLNPEIVIERFVSQTTLDFLLYPQWRLKNFEITQRIERKMKEYDTWQGKLYSEPNQLSSSQ